MMKHFYDKLVKEFENETDYKTINKNNRGGALKNTI